MKESFVRAAAAFGYIFCVGSLLNDGPPLGNIPHVYGGVIFLSLFVFSAALMGYLFFWKPAEFFIAGEKKQALHSLMSTIGYFLLIALVFIFGIVLAHPLP